MNENFSNNTLRHVKESLENGSFDLDSSNPPDATFQAHFVLKDVTGTFASGNTLTTHTGTISSYDSDTQVLSTTFENVIRTKGEPSSTVNEGIRLEDNSESEPHGILLEDEKDFDDGKHIVTNATSITTPTNTEETFTVTVKRNSADTGNAFYINGIESPRLSLARGNTYIFDTSDSSLDLIDYIYEPSQEQIINQLLPKSLKIQLLKSIKDSIASEHGARMTAMHKATDNATELRDQLKLTYNKARQAAITNEILEIVGGAEAVSYTHLTLPTKA